MRVKIVFDNGLERFADDIIEVDEVNNSVQFSNGLHSPLTEVPLTELETEYLKSLERARCYYECDCMDEEEFEEQEHELKVWDLIRKTPGVASSDGSTGEDLPF